VTVMAPRKKPEPEVAGGDNERTVAVAKLKNVVERYEALDEDKRAIGEDQKELMKEAKEIGLDGRAIKALVKARRDPAKTKAEAEINRLYAEALGLPDIFG